MAKITTHQGPTNDPDLAYQNLTTGPDADGQQASEAAPQPDEPPQLASPVALPPGYGHDGRLLDQQDSSGTDSPAGPEQEPGGAQADDEGEAAHAPAKSAKREEWEAYLAAEYDAPADWMAQVNKDELIEFHGLAADLPRGVWVEDDEASGGWSYTNPDET